MSEDCEKIGVDVWAAVTIYVEAETDEQAAAIVTERYAGSRDKIGGYNPIGGEDIPMEDGDFMSPAMTFYGLGNDSELLPAVDPVRAAAPDMLEALKACRNAMYADNPADGWAEIIAAADTAIAKAEGRA